MAVLGRKKSPFFEKGAFLTALAVFVALTQHIVESCNLALAAPYFAWLFKIALLARVADNAFAVELFLEPAKHFFHSFTLADF